MRLAAASDHAAGRALIQAAGGRVTRDLHIINGHGAQLSAAAARRLGHDSAVLSVTPDATIRPSALTSVYTPSTLLTALNASLGTVGVWTGAYAATGRGVTVAVIDTGIAGGLPDFRASQTDPTSRVLASVVTNPTAASANDGTATGPTWPA